MVAQQQTRIQVATEATLLDTQTLQRDVPNNA
jgi:hypothetical protein